MATKLLTNYIVSPTWVKILIFLCFYFIILSIPTNEITFCMDVEDIFIYKKKTMVLIEHDRIREYEDTIKMQEDLIKVKDQIIQFERGLNQTAKTIVAIEALLIAWVILSAIGSSFAK